MLHAFSLYFEGCARLREEVQSSKLKILPFGNKSPKRVWSRLLWRRLEADVWFQISSGSREVRQMPWFFLLYCRRNCVGERTRFNDMFRNMTCGSNESDLPYSCVKMEEQNRKETCALLRVVRNGSETSERSNGGRMTVRGVVEGLKNGETLGFGCPGQHQSNRWCEIRYIARGRKQASGLPPPPPPRPFVKEIKLASVTCS